MREALAVLLLAFSASLALALYSYTPGDPSFNQAVDAQPANALGLLGAYLSDLLLQMFGYGCLVLLWMLSLWTWRMLRAEAEVIGGWRAWFWLPALVSASALAGLHMRQGFSFMAELPAGNGGAVGSMIVEAFRLPLGFWGLSILLFAVLLSCAMLAGAFSPWKLWRLFMRAFAWSRRSVQRAWEVVQLTLQRRRERIEHRVRQRDERAAQIQSLLDRSQEMRLDAGDSGGKRVERNDAQPVEADEMPPREKQEVDAEEATEVGERALDTSVIVRVLDEVAEKLPEVESAARAQPGNDEALPDIPKLAAELETLAGDGIPDMMPAGEDDAVGALHAGDVSEKPESLDGDAPLSGGEPVLESSETPRREGLEKEAESTSKKSVSKTNDTPKPRKGRKKSPTGKQPEKRDVFVLPDMDALFLPAEPARTQYSEQELADMARLLEEKLRDYKVDGVVQSVRPGPVVTQFEYQPAPGIKVSRIVGLQDDLARSMAAISVRVAGNIPGKNVIGIELPNKERQTVRLHQVLASDAFQVDDKLLPLALGVDIAGRPVVTDLAAMPHLLVAGTTGSGKSVSINTMICSMLMKHTPETLRMIMVDPKMLELSMYDDIPHLLVPVVTDPKKAARALDWAVFEMERRYRLMSEAKVRSLHGYNELAMDRAEMERLPMIVIVIDELADLMMVAGKDVEQSICRLAQKARAAGLHLILATQRPSVDVITGLIKANLPSRLAFRVSSRVDARTILDQMGAEQLLGQGDALLMTGGCNMSRVHGAFVSDAEVQALTDYLRTQGTPEYHEEVFEPPVGGSERETKEQQRDSKYDEAMALVIEKGQCSVSMIQRHLRIGYNRAGRIVDQMERDGVVSAPGTGGIRQVLARRAREDA